MRQENKGVNKIQDHKKKNNKNKKKSERVSCSDNVKFWTVWCGIRDVLLYVSQYVCWFVLFIWERNGEMRKRGRERVREREKRERRHKDMETGTSGRELNRYIGPRGREDESEAVGSGKKLMNG